jgi:rhamnose utilization protein RhaD (predicted bifunctional aldolase and dehydrogenase)
MNTETIAKPASKTPLRPANDHPRYVKASETVAKLQARLVELERVVDGIRNEEQAAKDRRETNIAALQADPNAKISTLDTMGLQQRKENFQREIGLIKSAIEEAGKKASTVFAECEQEIRTRLNPRRDALLKKRDAMIRALLEFDATEAKEFVNDCDSLQVSQGGLPWRDTIRLHEATNWKLQQIVDTFERGEFVYADMVEKYRREFGISE